MRPWVLAAWLALFAAPSVAGDRLLLVVLDAVPYATMERLTGPGRAPLFRDFGPPRPLISTFPSSTSIALAGILGDHGLARSPGYEARFFDWDEGRRRGGGPLSYFRVDFPWRGYFDWNRRGPVRNAWHAARPVRAGIGEMRRALAAFEASAAPAFTIYIADTDTAAHLFGPTGLDPMLEALDAELSGVRERLGPGLRTVLLSDHGLAGGEPLRNVLPSLRRALAASGFTIDHRLRGPRSVVLTPYGLVSSLEAYTAPESAPEVARLLATVEGVELCVRRDARGWVLESRRHTLRFEHREAPEPAWRWEVRGTADDGVAAALAGVAPPGEWVDDDRLLAATASGAYPDPLYRLAGAFSSVENPASVVCSTAPGFMYGARGTERSARWTKGRLRWTHGSLRRDASLGFLMTDAEVERRLAPLRYDRALAAALKRPLLRQASQ